MTHQTILEYVKGEYQRLEKLFGDYRSHAENMDSLKSRNNLDALLAQLQEHIFHEENIFFPLYEKTPHLILASEKTDQLRREHASMRELISMISQKQDQGASAAEEQETFHVLFINHTKNEEDVIDVLDRLLPEKERQAALAAAMR